MIGMCFPTIATRRQHFTERSNTIKNGTKIGQIALNFAQSVFQLICYKF